MRDPATGAVVRRRMAAAVSVKVTVPAGLAAGTVNTATVTATSVGDSSVSASATDVTTARGWPYAVYLPFVPRDYQ